MRTAPARRGRRSAARPPRAAAAPSPGCAPAPAGRSAPRSRRAPGWTRAARRAKCAATSARSAVPRSAPSRAAACGARPPTRTAATPARPPRRGGTAPFPRRAPAPARAARPAWQLRASTPRRPRWRFPRRRTATRGALPAPGGPCTLPDRAAAAAARRGRPAAAPAAARARAACAAGCRCCWLRAAEARFRTLTGRAARDAEVAGVWVVEDDRRNARLGVHHAAVGQLDADLLWTQDAEEDLLVFQAGAGRVPERVPLAVVVRLEAVDHRHRQLVGETPLAAQLGVEQLRVCLGRLQSQRLQQVALEEIAVLL